MVRIPNPVPENLEPYLHGKSDHPLPRFRSRRTKAILAYLAAKQRPVAREHLAALFWPDEPTSSGRGNLSRELHNLAKILPDCWELDRQSVAFCPSESIDLDIHLLDRWHKQRWIKLAADLVGGDFMEGLYLEDNLEFETWLQHERDFWRGKSKLILQEATETSERAGDFDRALQMAYQWVEIAPWSESAHQRLMRLLSWTGQDELALRHYATCKKLLRDELDVEPSTETKTLYHQISIGTLPPPPSRPGFLNFPERKRQEDNHPFVGRQNEIVHMETALSSALNGEVQFMFIAGSPGQGKSMLMDAFAQRALSLHPDLLVVKGKCSALSNIGDPYLPFREILAMLTGDVEALWEAGVLSTSLATRLWLSAPRVIEHLLTSGRQVLDIMVPVAHILKRCQDAARSGEDWAKKYLEYVDTSNQSLDEFKQGYLFQQFSNVLGEIAKDQPIIIMLDDIHWADPGSAGLLFHLGRQLVITKQPIMVICAYRPTEFQLRDEEVNHPIVKILHEFKRTYGDIWIHLGEEPEEVRKEFINAILDTELNAVSEDFRSELFKRTKGHPLFTVELLGAMQDRGDVYQDENKVWQDKPALDWKILPSRIEAVIADRIARLNGGMKELIMIASVVGETFTSHVIADVLGQDEHAVIDAISQKLANQYRLVTEDGSLISENQQTYRFRFRHILYQEFLYKQIGGGKRQILHGQIATALENFGSKDYSDIAYHFNEAGQSAKALRYITLAGQHALTVYANQEAESFLRSAFALAKDKNEKAQIVSSLSEAVFRQNHLDEAKSLCRQGINLFLERGDLDQVAKLYNLICKIEKGTSPKSFLATVIEGMERLENAPASEEMVIFYLNCVRAHYFNNRFEELKPFIQITEEMAEHLGTTSARTVALFAKSYQLLATNANEDVEWVYKTVIEINENEKDSIFHIHLAYLNLAIWSRNKNPKTALGYSRGAIKIAKQVGSMLQEGNARTMLIKTLAFTGNFTEAKNELDKFEDVSKNAGHEFSHLAYPAEAQGILFGYQGYHQNAENILYRIWSKVIETNIAQTINSVGLHLGEFLIELNKTTEARTIIDLLLKEYYSILQPDYKLRPLTLNALLNVYQGETKRAEKMLEKLTQDYATDLKWSHYEMLYFLRAKGLLLVAEKKWEEAWMTFSEAVDMASSAGFNWMHTRLRLHWAEAHFAHGGKEYLEQGIAMMEQSQSEFEEMGADGWVQIIENRKNKS